MIKNSILLKSLLAFLFVTSFISVYSLYSAYRPYRYHRYYHRRGGRIGPGFGFGLMASAMISAAAAEEADSSKVSYKDLKRVEEGIREDLVKDLKKLATKIDDILDSLEKDMDSIEERIAKLEERIDQLESR